MAVIGAYLGPHPPLIFPEIGQGEERAIQATINAYRRMGAEIRALSPQTVVVMSPHSVFYSDYFHISPGAGAQGDMSAFGAGQVKLAVAYDTDFIAALCALAKDAGIPAGTQGERKAALDHGTMIPLRFIGPGGYRVVRIGIAALSLQTHRDLGFLIARAAETLGTKTVFVASGDLSHKLREDGPYGFAPEGPQFDRAVTDMIRRGAIGEILGLRENFCEAAAECGLRPLAALAGVLEGAARNAGADGASRNGAAPSGPASELYSYEGPFGVGYAVARFRV